MRKLWPQILLFAAFVSSSFAMVEGAVRYASLPPPRPSKVIIPLAMIAITIAALIPGMMLMTRADSPVFARAWRRRTITAWLVLSAVLLAGGLAAYLTARMILSALLALLSAALLIAAFAAYVPAVSRS